MSQAAAPLRLPALLAYGLFGLPLAMVALPIYVYLPQFYALRSGMTLAAIGLVLLATRLLAAFCDPALGWWIERSRLSYARHIGSALPLLLLGFGALFHPPALGGAAALAWFLASLTLVYLGFGLAMIAHQSWGAALTQAPGQRTRVAAAREGCGLLGVVGAAALTAVFGYDGLSLAFAALLLLTAGLLLFAAPRPARVRSAVPTIAVPASASAPISASACVPVSALAPPSPSPPPLAGLLAPLCNASFRALFLVLIVNGVAAAIPATLFLFFAQDKLRLGAGAGLYLIVYFGAAAASIPCWVALARRIGEARAWVAGMVASALVFVWAYGLDAGPAAAWGFGAICLLSGLSCGADLALPSALLAGVIGRAGHGGRREAAYFGLWNWGVQINLALAAGIALPLLGWLGYVPGRGGGTAALSAAYALLPCALKLAAAAMLWRAPLRDY